ncbi:aldo/keto reductase [Sinomonas susongensis]|uniref:aldo/keto reductase n=1 Tax=Sinomonas susongensis TaxID=1324851 RepID=UPI001107F480|nr:aldo/keto reductase [Sinomonas susongensis]
MKQRTIGNVPVSAIGLGGMPMSIEGRPDERQSVATIHAALDAGVTLIDTADAYHLAAQDEVGHNEELISRAVRAYSGDVSHVVIATKGGHLRPEEGPWAKNGDPEYLKKAAKASARRLGVEAIDLYQYHRPDPQVPYADSIGALAELLDEGVIRMAGISNANVEQIREAQEVLGGRLVSVQNQFSPKFRSSEPELELCAEMGIAFLPWSPLGGISSARDLGSNHDEFALVAQKYGVSPQVVALAWELAKADVVIPIPGASRPESILDSATAPDLELTPEDLGRLDSVSASAAS